MYSMVLVMALAGSADAPNCNWGCMGSWGGHGCMGSGGIFGGCHGSGYGGCYGSGYGFGGCYGSSYGGGYAVYSGGCTGSGGYYVGPGNEPPKAMPGSPEPLKDPKKKDQVRAPLPGVIIVNLPADAKLAVDGYVTQQNLNVRTLVTPPIQPGAEFTYTLVAEANQNGQPASQTQRVTVRPGERVSVNFTFAATPVGAGH